MLHNTAAVTGRSEPVPGVAQVGAAIGVAVPVLPSGRVTNPVVALLGLAAAATEAVAVRGHGTAGRSHAAVLTLGAIING